MMTAERLKRDHGLSYEGQSYYVDRYLKIDLMVDEEGKRNWWLTDNGELVWIVDREIAQGLIVAMGWTEEPDSNFWEGREIPGTDLAIEYAPAFARSFRPRWKLIGACGEDLLYLNKDTCRLLSASLQSLLTHLDRVDQAAEKNGETNGTH